MQRIDAHQHFWNFDPVRDSWITSEMGTIRRDFLPQDLFPVLQQNGFSGSVVVQSDQSEAENRFQLEHAHKFDFIKGVVGWVDMRSPDLEERLEYYAGFEKMKGFRHVLQGEPDRAFMLQPAFMNGIGKLERFGFTYDILIYADQLQYSSKFAAAFPNQPLVLDHIAKPLIKAGEIDDWAMGIRQLAQYENVSCKVSGMVTEADWANWRKEDLRPYLDIVVNAFGCDRLMFGSDWPVCLVAAPYNSVVEIVAEYFSGFSVHEQEAIFGLNASRFYNL